MSTYVQTQVASGIGQITLTRLKALNALDQSMIRDMDSVLRSWRTDDNVRAVIVRSASDRAFCAGGDIRGIREAAMVGDTATISAFFGEEYQLNELIATYPKPYVSLIDGAAMGGGLGISVHGSVRIVTDKAFMAMPETAIGFFPDVGASYFLPRLNVDGRGLGAIGAYLGTTGARVSAADAIACTLATHFIPSADLAGFLTVLADTELDAALDQFSQEPDPSTLVADLDEIEQCFAGTTLDGVLQALDDSTPWRTATRKMLAAMSPSSVAITIELLARGATSTLRECLDRELALSEKVTADHDFSEGVRAVLVDKDRNPQWRPATFDGVGPTQVTALFG